MITAVPVGAQIPYLGIKNGAISNNDGHGWAVASPNGLFVGKSLKWEEALAEFVAVREREGIGSSAGLFHSRWATHGIMGTYNVHPFYVGEAQTTVMAHNGVLPSKYHPEKDDSRSDTRILADRMGWIVDNARGVPSRKLGGWLGGEIGGGNKLVFLSVASGKPVMRIINSHLGIFEQGVWFSNSGYCRTRSHSYSWPAKKGASSSYSGLGSRGYSSYGGGSRAWDDDWGTSDAHAWWDQDRFEQRVIGGQNPGEWIGGVWVPDNLNPKKNGSSILSSVPASTDASIVTGRAVEYVENPVDECRNCLSHDLDWKGNYCRDCLSCLDCADFMGDCVCFIPVVEQMARDSAIYDAMAAIVDRDEKARERAAVEAEAGTTLFALPAPDHR